LTHKQNKAHNHPASPTPTPLTHKITGIERAIYSQGSPNKKENHSLPLKMPHHEENNFSAPAQVVDFSALLFDMDGTIIDSTPAIVKYWQETGRQIGVDGDGEW
jgi:hypothetical protein